MGYTLRTEKYRYTAWFEIDFRKGEKPVASKIIAVELYDYITDINEIANHAGEPGYAQIKKELSAKLLGALN